MEDILDDLELLPEEMLETIVDRIGIGDPYHRALDTAWVKR
jgi:hypothetical protein